MSPKLMNHTAMGLMFNGKLNVNLLQNSLAIVFTKHSCSSTGWNLNSILDFPLEPLSFVSLNQADDLNNAELFARIVNEERCKAFRDNHALARAVLFSYSPSKHVLVLFAERSICDGLSWSLIQREIVAAYASNSTDRLRATETSISFSKFLDIRKERCQSGYFHKHVEYWTQQWKEFGADRIAPEHLPFATPSSSEIYSLGRARISFSDLETQQLRAFARKFRLSLYMLFIATLVIVLAQYTGKSKVPLWSLFANRIDPQFAYAVGRLTTIHLLGFICEGTLTGCELLESVSTVVFNALSYQEMPLQHLWNVSLSRPLTNFTLLFGADLTRDIADKAVVPGLTCRRIMLPDTSLPRLASLGLYVEDQGGNISLRSQYREQNFSGASITALLEDMKTVACRLMKEPDMPIWKFADIGERYPSKQVGYFGMDERIVTGWMQFMAASDSIPPS